MLTDSYSFFSDQEGQFFLNPDESIVLSFFSNSSFDVANIRLSVWPVRHEYAIKDDIFFIRNGFDYGDINFDYNLNILDVVILINYIVGNINLSDSQIELSDFNDDDSIDILDITAIIYNVVNN